MQDNVGINIIAAKVLQKISYANRYSRSDSDFKIGKKVLLKNFRRKNGKGG